MASASFLARMGFIGVDEASGLTGLKIGLPIPCAGCGALLTLRLAFNFNAPQSAQATAQSVGEMTEMVERLEAEGRIHPTPPTVNLDLTGVTHAGTPCDYFLAELSKP